MNQCNKYKFIGAAELLELDKAGLRKELKRAYTAIRRRNALLDAEKGYIEIVTNKESLLDRVVKGGK